MTEGEGHWENLAIAFSEGRVRPGMKLRPYFDRKKPWYGLDYTTEIVGIGKDPYTKRHYLAVGNGLEFREISDSYEVDLDGRADL